MLFHQSVARSRCIRSQAASLLNPHGFSQTCPVLLKTQNVHGHGHIGAVDQHRFSTASHYELAIRASNANNARKWINRIENALPQELRRSSISSSIQALPSPIQSLPLDVIILEAGKQADLDILTYIGFVQGRSKALLWIVDTILHEHVFHNSVRNGDLPTSNVHTVRQASLDDLTTWKGPIEQGRYGDHWNLQLVETKQTCTLAELTASSPSTINLIVTERSTRVLGHIWRSLGRLIMYATDRNHSECVLLMDLALRVLAKLRRSGLIPDASTKHHGLDESSLMRIPELLSLLSSQMLSSLVDIPDDSFFHDPKVDAESDENYFSMVARYPPELWLELVLWCSVQGGWITEACDILQELRSLDGQKRWSSISWKVENASSGSNYSLQSFSNESVTTEQPYMVDLEGLDVLYFSFGEVIVSKRTVSREMIIAVQESLMAMAFPSTAYIQNLPFRELVNRITELNNWVAPPGMGLKQSGWSDICQRLFNYSTLTQRTPRLMDALLEFFEQQITVMKSSDTTAADSPCELEEAGAATGLLHQMLDECVQMRDLDQVLRVVTCLQSLTDVKKAKKLRSLFRSLRKADSLHESKSTLSYSSLLLDSEKNPESLNHCESFTQIPTSTLAAFLNLVTDTDNFGIGRWMVFSTEDTDTLITSDLYSDQIIAPVLIRFAALAMENALLANVIAAQGMPALVSGEMLVALYAARISQCHWDNAAEILKHLQYKFNHVWTANDLVYVIQALIPHLADRRNENLFRRSSELIEYLLRKIPYSGNSICTASQSQSIVAVMRTIHPMVKEAVKDLPGDDNVVSTAMSSDMFLSLLQSAVATYGSEAGMSMYFRWCRPREVAIPTTVGEAESSGVEHDQVRLQSTYPAEAAAFAERMATNTVDAPITPSLKHIHTIIRQALRELHATKRHHRSETKHNVLDGIYEILLQDFLMSLEDIHYYLKGYNIEKQLQWDSDIIIKDE